MRHEMVQCDVCFVSVLATDTAGWTETDDEDLCSRCADGRALEAEHNVESEAT